MKLFNWSLSALLGVQLLAFSFDVHSEQSKRVSPKPVPKALQRLPANIGKPSDIVGVEIAIAPTERPGVQRATVKIKNSSASSVNWLDWQLKLKSGNNEKFLGLGSITTIDGGATHTFTADFVPLATQVSLDVAIDTKQNAETNAAIRGNNQKSVTWTGALAPASISTVPLDPARALTAGAIHDYAPRSGMTGCTMAVGPVGANALAVNMTCTAAAMGELRLFQGYALKNGWRVNGVAVGMLSGGSIEPRAMPLAGSDEPAMTIGVSGAPGAAPVVMVSIDLFGPATTLPY